MKIFFGILSVAAIGLSSCSGETSCGSTQIVNQVWQQVQAQSEFDFPGNKAIGKYKADFFGKEAELVDIKQAPQDKHIVCEAKIELSAEVQDGLTELMGESLDLTQARLSYKIKTKSGKVILTEVPFVPLQQGLSVFSMIKEFQ